MRLLYFFQIFIGLILIQACSTSKSLEKPAYTTELDTVEVEPEAEIPIYQAAETRVNDLLHTKLEVSFDWDSSYMHGKAWLTLTPYFYPIDSLTLDAKGQRIEEVALVDELGKTTALQFAYDTMQLKIDLNRSYTRKDTYQIYIEYTAMPDVFESGGSAAITNEKGLYFINPKGEDPDKPKQIWTQGETESSSRWFPTIDAPNEKTTQEIYITVDTVYETLSNGKLLFQTENEDGSRTDYWKQDLPHAPYLFMMAIGDYAIVKDQWRDIPVNYYVEHEYEAFAKDIFPNTVEMLEFFSNKLNYEYPWDKYHQVVVRDYVSGAMENTGAVIYGTFVQGDDRYLIDNSGEDVVAHELFHHWFGDLVTTESWANLPLNESFATYGEYLWNEHKYGKDHADYGLNVDLNRYLDDAKIERKQLIRYGYKDKMDMFDTHSYQKGGRVLHMLRQEVGDEAFFKSLEVYLKENEFQPAEIDHLRLAFEEVSGRDLHWFFNQWFLAAGHPELEVEKKYVDSTHTLVLNLSQTQEGDNVPRAFKLPIDIEFVDSNGGVFTESILMEKRVERYTFEFDEKPLLVNLDAGKTLLAVIDQEFTEAEAVVLYRKGVNYLDRRLAIEALRRAKDSASLNVIAEALNDPYWNIRQKAIQQSKYLAKERGGEVKEKLVQLAKYDSVSDVRAEALIALSDLFPNQTNVEIFQTALNDPSYLVVASALGSLAEIDRNKALEEAEKLESTEDNNIIYTISGLYAQETKPKYNQFFLNKLNGLSGFSKYPIIVNYQEYLVSQVGDNLNKGISELAETARNEDSWFVRMAAANTLIQIKRNYQEASRDLEKQMTESTDPAASVELKQQQNELLKVVGKIQSELREIADLETNPKVKNRLLKEVN